MRIDILGMLGRYQELLEDVDKAIKLNPEKTQHYKERAELFEIFAINENDEQDYQAAKEFEGGE